jgi:hypothetical protein
MSYIPTSELFFYPGAYIPDGVLDFMPGTAGVQVTVNGESVLEFNNEPIANLQCGFFSNWNLVNGEAVLPPTWLLQPNFQCTATNPPPPPPPPLPRPTASRNTKPLWTVTYFS